MENQEKSIIEKIIAGFLDSLEKARKVQKVLTKEQKEIFLKRHNDAITPNPGLAKVKAVNGIKAEVVQITKNIKDECKTALEKTNQRYLALNEKMAQINPYIYASRKVR